jgi:hypothetical protein
VREAVSALASGYPEADELPELAALVQAAFPGANITEALNRRPLAEAAASSSTPSAVVTDAVLTVRDAYPNPSGSMSRVPFELGAEAVVEAVLYDGLGRRVAVLVSGHFGAGRHEVSLGSSDLPAGVYVVYVTARSGDGREHVAVRRFTIAR